MRRSDLLAQPLGDDPGNFDAGGAGLSQAAGGARTVANGEEVLHRGFKLVGQEKGVITIYLTQGSDGTYNDGKTAAKYQSSDKGETWSYISQLEITQNSSSKTSTGNN